MAEEKNITKAEDSAASIKPNNREADADIASEKKAASKGGSTKKKTAAKGIGSNKGSSAGTKKSSQGKKNSSKKSGASAKKTSSKGAEGGAKIGKTTSAGKKKVSSEKKSAQPIIADSASALEEGAEERLERHVSVVPADTDNAVFTPLEISEDEDLKTIESQAIAALPRAEVEPELLIYDNGEIEDTHETPEEAAKYEDYLRNFKATMAEMLKNAKNVTATNEGENEASGEALGNEAVVSELGESEGVAEDGEDEAEASVEALGNEAVVSELGESEGVAEEGEDEAEASVEALDNEADLYGEISRDRKAKGFDPLSTISLLEYVPSLLGEEDEDEEVMDNIPQDEEPSDTEYSEDGDAEKYYVKNGECENEDEYEGPEQLSMSFGDGGGEDELPDKNTYDPKKPRGIDSLFDLIELFVLTFVSIMVITTFFFRHSVIDGRSMEKTLFDGDIVIISNFLYTPERGDIVVLDDRSAHDGALIKRVIGIEGDIVSVKRDGTIYVNGRELDDEYYVYVSNPSHIYREKTWSVGKGEIFVLGDHRDISDDSENLGPVSADAVLGKVLFRVYPFSLFGTVD